MRLVLEVVHEVGPTQIVEDHVRSLVSRWLLLCLLAWCHCVAFVCGLLDETRFECVLLKKKCWLLCWADASHGISRAEGAAVRVGRSQNIASPTAKHAQNRQPTDERNVCRDSLSLLLRHAVRHVRPIPMVPSSSTALTKFSRPVLELLQPVFAD